MKKIIKTIINTLFIFSSQNPIITVTTEINNSNKVNFVVSVNNNSPESYTKRDVSTKTESIVYIADTPINIVNSPIHIINTPIEITNVPTNIRNGTIDISNSPVNITKSEINIINTEINIHNNQNNNQNNIIINDNTDKPIILPLKITETQMKNGCAVAAMQNVIKYVSNQTIQQPQLAQELDYSSLSGTTINPKFLNVLNKYLSNNLKNKKYYYTWLREKFGETKEELEWFYNIVHESLKNNDPVIMIINGYLEENYGHNIINHAVVINGIKKGKFPEENILYISDSSYIRRDYLEIKEVRISKLFKNSGGIIYAI